MPPRPNTMPLDDIAKEDFEAYEHVRISGVTNMLSPDVRELAGISRDVHYTILRHYEALCAKWPDVRKL